MIGQVFKKFDGKKYIYFFNGKIYRKSTRDFKFACIATPAQSDNSKSFVLSLGNDIDSTRRSKAPYFEHWCYLTVVTIESFN